ncbi:hypothetical protein AGMMS50268_33770 [Spirochaetia bacterium]|nr:hypothetical protein AGMMS50268_33770 [Spirochaetia bacterium]
MNDKRLKPILVHYLQYSEIVDIKVFNTLKDFYLKYKDRLHYKNYNSFKATLAQCGYYNTINLMITDYSVIIESVNILFPEDFDDKNKAWLSSINFWKKI